jgi:hypothetical protein
LAVGSLHLDDWQANRDVGETIASPTWADVVAALGRLDGDTHTLLSLQHSSGATLQVGGGPSEFVVQFLENESCWCVTSERAPDQVLQLVAGGQLGDYPADLCVSSSQARGAAESFFVSGTRARKLTWRKEA